MAKYTVTRSCGHEETVQITGPGSGRDNQASYESTKLCSACYAAKRQSERDAANQAAATESAAQGLPALVGTDKQVVWATTIRHGILHREAEIAAKIATAPDNAQRAQAQALLAQAVLGLKAQTSAAWWIDNRDAVTIEREIKRLYKA